jgi:hypothetical protein
LLLPPPRQPNIAVTSLKGRNSGGKLRPNCLKVGFAGLIEDG